MKRGRKEISLAITLSLVLSLILPGQAAWAEEQPTMQDIEVAQTESADVATLEPVDEEVVDNLMEEGLDEPAVEGDTLETSSEDEGVVEQENAALESAGNSDEGDGSGLENVDNGYKSEMVFGWGVERVVLPDTSVRVGEAFNALARVSGSHSTLSYSFSWTRQGGGGSGTLTGSSSSNRWSCTFNESGLYTIKAVVTDAEGHSSFASKNIYVYELKDAALSWTGSRYVVKPNLGCSSTYCHDIEYRYTWKYGSSSGVLKDWSRDVWCDFSASDIPAKSGTVSLVVEARDSNGSFGKVTTPYKSWKLERLVLPSTSARRGSTVTATAKIAGNGDGLTYSFTWNLNGSSSAQNNGVTVGDSSSNTRSCRFGSVGLFTLTVKVTDELGRSATASKKIYSYALLKANLTKSGSTYMLKPDMGCSTTYLDGVEYRYVWKQTGTSKSGVLKDWSRDTWCSFSYYKFQTATSAIQVTVEVRDPMGYVGSKSATFSTDYMDVKAQGYSSPTNYLVMVDNKDCYVGVYVGYKGNWTRVKRFRCSTGADHRTPDGVFSIGARGYSFSGADYTCYWYTDYYLGLYAFHSVLYHLGTNSVSDSRLGYHISAGCIRLHIDAAKWIYDNVPYASTVVIYWE